MMLTSLNMMGDSGTEYTITVDPVTSAARCSCPAYRFAQDKGLAVCKHIAYVAELLST